MNEQDLSARQAQALAFLRGDKRRDLYEGAGPDGRSGSGRFWITHTAGENYAPWTQAEIDEMVAVGAIVERYPDCYTTPENLRARPNRA